MREATAEEGISLSAVNAADAAGVTAAIPATPKTTPAAGVEQPSAGCTGTAAAGRQQKVDRSKSPYIV